MCMPAQLSPTLRVALSGIRATELARSRRSGARARAPGQGTNLVGRRSDTRRTNAREGGKVARRGFPGACISLRTRQTCAVMVPGAPADPECPLFCQVVAGRSSVAGVGFLGGGGSAGGVGGVF